MTTRITIEEAAHMVGLTRNAIEHWCARDGLAVSLERNTTGHGPGMVRTLDRVEFEAAAKRRGYLG